MEIIGYLAAILIGLSLGLIGGGGSILTVPVLFYLFKVEAVQATSYSLFIVGVSSLAGAFQNYRNGFISIKTALLFGIASMTTVYIARKFIVPRIPDEIITIKGFIITQSLLTVVLFAILMLLASISMIRRGNKELPVEDLSPLLRTLKMLAYGVGIGLVTGFLGAGGGFLLVPALVLLLHLPMNTAVGTSLLIIALNSLIGFTGDIGHFVIDWQFLLKLTAIALAGILLGTRLARIIPGSKLKKGFGWFVLLMAIVILTMELLVKHRL